MTAPTRTDLAAGALVALGSIVGLASVGPGWSVLPPAVLTAAPVAVLLGVVLLVAGLGREPGLSSTSPWASAALLACVLPTVTATVLATASAGLDPGQISLLGLAASPLALASPVGGVVAAAVVVRRRLLGPWARRALVAALACRVAWAVVAWIPLIELQEALHSLRVAALVPATMLLFGLALALRGRGPAARRAVDDWRDSTSVTGPVRRRP